MRNQIGSANRGPEVANKVSAVGMVHWRFRPCMTAKPIIVVHWECNKVSVSAKAIWRIRKANSAEVYI